MLDQPCQSFNYLSSEDQEVVLENPNIKSLQTWYYDSSINNTVDLETLRLKQRIVFLEEEITSLKEAVLKLNSKIYPYF